MIGGLKWRKIFHSKITGKYLNEFLKIFVCRWWDPWDRTPPKPSFKTWSTRWTPTATEPSTSPSFSPWWPERWRTQTGKKYFYCMVPIFKIVKILWINPFRASFAFYIFKSILLQKGSSIFFEILKYLLYWGIELWRPLYIVKNIGRGCGILCAAILCTDISLPPGETFSSDSLIDPFIIDPNRICSTTDINIPITIVTYCNPVG